MKALPRAMHLFRQSSETKLYTNPDVKCFQDFHHHCTLLKPDVPQGLLYERCSNLNCSTIHYSYAFPGFFYHTYIFPKKKKPKKYNLTQNCPKHYRCLQKTISCYYYVSDFIQLLIRKIIRAAFRDASFWYSLLSSDCTHFGDFLSRRLHLHHGVPLAWVNCFAINLSNYFWSSLALREPSHSVAVRSANYLWIV